MYEQSHGKVDAQHGKFILYAHGKVDPAMSAISLVPMPRPVFVSMRGEPGNKASQSYSLKLLSSLIMNT